MFIMSNMLDGLNGSYQMIIENDISHRYIRYTFMASVCLVDGFQAHCYAKKIMTYCQGIMPCHVNHYSSSKALEDYPSMPLLNTYMLYSILIFYLNQIPSNGTLLHYKTLDMTIQARKKSKKNKLRIFPSKLVNFLQISYKLNHYLLKNAYHP